MQINSSYIPQGPFTSGQPQNITNRNTAPGSANVSSSVLLDLQSRRGDDILRLIQQIFGHQTHASNISNGGTMRSDAFDFMMDNITPTQAQELIGEDGFFGVERTSERLFNMAVAFSGGDPRVMEEMRQAVIDGFNAAAAAWGGELPQISHDTLARTMERFDQWFELNA
ncbi:MAG: hypothetical protein FWE02_04235 [Defluviitaleaceae bacterium]|nr:hypothetical protein [Defluviitaleaceae bacterium]